MPVKCHLFDDKINSINEPRVRVELFKCPNKRNECSGLFS